MKSFEFSSRRSPVLGQAGMVATSQPLAAAAGVEMLRQGGSAADAAVATAAALGVVEPMSTGLGGDLFALYYEAASGQVTALNGSGRSAHAQSLERLAKEGFTTELPSKHGHCVTVPGTAAGWLDLLERYGRLEVSQVLAPAIRLAEEGFPVAPVTAHQWQTGLEKNLAGTSGAQVFSLDGRAPHAGEIFRNPGLARAMQAIAAGGKQAFYTGPIAEAIVAAVEAAGGCLDLSDLASHSSEWVQPVSAPYRDVRVWECPPNGQGLTVLLALNILEGYDLASLPPLSASRLHLEIEALRLAFADARWHISDPAFHPLPLDDLLSKEYAAHQRSRIDPARARLDQQASLEFPKSNTVYLSVVDAQGNACSFINSIYFGFGSGIVPAGWGFCLHNRGRNFRLDPAHPNALQPGKRPYHTIIPALATREADGSLFSSFGVMGAFMQPQGQLQVLSGLVDDRLDPQAALDRPRFCLLEGEPGATVALEEGIPLGEMARLAEMGHIVTPVSGWSRAYIFGRGQVITREPDTRVLWGGSDPRADGCALTL